MKNIWLKKFASFNEALNYYFTHEIILISKKEAKYENQINELKRIIEEQEATISSLRQKENEDREKAELIYNNYKLISEILSEINSSKETILCQSGIEICFMCDLYLIFGDVSVVS